MTDTTRYKSIIVRVETHAKLKQMAGTDKKISGIVSQLVEKEWKKENRKAVQLLLSNEEEAPIIDLRRSFFHSHGVSS